MRKRLLLACVPLLSIALCTRDAAAQSLGWARQAGGSDNDEGRAVVADAAGNTYVTGTFGKSLSCSSCGTGATFGAGGGNQTVLTSVSGSQDIFIAKYDNNGMLLWARGAGGADADEAWGIAVDPFGNSYVTGSLGRFTSVADFGGGVTLTVNGNGSWSFVFVAKYDSGGNALWATSLGLGGAGVAIAVDETGSSQVTGSAPDPLLGGDIVTTWKLGPTGNVLWTRQASGNYSGGGRGISVDVSDNIYIAGTFQSGSATFGTGEPNATILTAGAAGEIFIAKYDVSGNLVWARQSSTGSGSFSRGLSTDNSGNSYIVGNGATVLGSGGPNQTAVSGTFLAKYDTLGNLAWAKSILGNGSAVEGNGIAASTSGHSYITGSFATSVTFASGDTNETTLVSRGGFQGGDIFVTKYEPDGRFAWARQAGGDAATGGLFEAGNGISVDATGRAYVTGIFSGSSTFGPGDANQTVLTSSGPSNVDIFLASFLDDAPTILDLDIAGFRVTNRVSLTRVRPVEILLIVRNNGTVTGSASATVVGTQGGTEIYRETLQVSDAIGGPATTFALRTFVPTLAGDITWTATIADQHPDVDQATAVSTIVP